MNKFFDYLMADLPLYTIRELLQYICRFVGAVAGETPVEGRLGSCRFCASCAEDGVRVHWVQVGYERIPIEATV